MSVYAATMDVLTPLVGKPVAEICIRSAAMEAGKPATELAMCDLDHVEAKIRADMATFASRELIDRAVVHIRTIAT